MYTITKEEIIIENKKRTVYGIRYGDICINDITTDRDGLERLIGLCNSELLDPIHLEDVVMDFIG